MVNQRIVSAMLPNLGYGGVVVVNGVDALKALDDDINQYAAVFMDCQMPVMDGYQTTEKIRQREGTDRHKPVIAVTASAMASDRARCLESGMDDYLTKPLREELVAAALDRWAVHAGD